ncbi:MAG: arabinofuranosyltransferase [Anaerolineales bacterium]|nr:arabinofuranosyltransferase [Anaerolineales bacterium]
MAKIFTNRPGLLLSLAILIAGVLALFTVRASLPFLPERFGSDPYLGAWARLIIFVTLFACAFIFMRIQNEQFKVELVAVLLGVCFSALVFYVLRETSYSFNGIAGDQGFITVQVTKFAYFSKSVDFAYAQLPAFYPPLYFFVLGKIAAALSIEPYKIIKYGLIVVAFFLPLVSVKLWSRIRAGELAVFPLFALLIFQEWYKPYEWLTLVAFIPWWLYAIEGIEPKKGASFGCWLLNSLIGAVLFSTYYYWFFIGGISLILRIVFRPIREEFGFDYKSGFMVLLGSAIFSSAYWAPFLASMWRSGGWTSYQNRYFLPDFNNLTFPFLESSSTGLLLLAGLAYLLVTFKHNRISSGLLGLLIGAYVWQILGYVGLLFDTPLLIFKARDFIVYLLAAATGLAIGEVWSYAKRKAAWKERWAPSLLGATIILGLFTGQSVVKGLVENELLQPALRTQYPTDLVSGYRKIVGEEPVGHVILGDGNTYVLSAYMPVFQFLSWAADYSHPAGLYEERVDFLQKLSRLENPAWFAAALMNNRYDHVNEILLHNTGENYGFGYRPNQFPMPVTSETIYFAKDIFDPKYFDQYEIGNYVLFIPNYGADPLLEFPEPSSYDAMRIIDGLGDGDDFYEFLLHFGGHVRFNNQQAYWEFLHQSFGN